MHRLRIINSENHIDQMVLKEGSYSIGRSLDSSLRLESADVSRLHARLVIGNTECRVIDENSTNGTFINGRPITQHSLSNGDIIQIGKFKLEFSSKRISHHHSPNTAKRRKGLIWPLLAITFILAVPGVYNSILWKEKQASLEVQLAQASSRYIAEKNKEALYLGEYNSLNLNGLPPQIVQAVIFDRHNIIRAYQPHTGKDKPDIKNVYSKNQKTIYLNKHTLGIYTPVHYNAVRVGTLWIKYKPR